MITKIYKLFRAGLVCCCATAALTACSPEKFDGPNQGGIPSISNVDINTIVDQTVNQATFTVANMPAQTYAIWKVNGETYSTLNPMNWANNKAGTYDVELRLGNRNGFSQGSITKQFTFENSQIDFTPYYSRIARTWRINYAEQGHMGCGEPGTDGSNWWSAAPGDKADWGVYDDRITFTADGNYAYDPGEGGTVYMNTGCTYYDEYNTKDGNDYMAPVEPQASLFRFDVDGDKIVLILDDETLFPYISSDSQFMEPVFTVVKLTNSEMVLLYEGEGITWRFMLTSKEDTEAPFSGFKANSDFNMWKNVEYNMFFYYAPGWNQIANPEFVANGNDYTVTLTEATTDQWQAQMAFKTTNISTSAANNYDFSCIINSSNDLNGVTVKLVMDGDDNVFYFTDRIDLKAGEDYIFWKSDMPGIDMERVNLFFDFGGCQAGTVVNISNIVLKDHANDDGTVLPNNDTPDNPDQPKMDWDYESGANLWKAVDDGTLFDAFGYWFADNSWTQIPNSECVHNGDTYEITLPEGMGGSQWQGQFHIDTKLTALASKAYNFYFVMEADQDCPQVTIKLTDSGDTNFFCEGRHDVKADEPFIFKLTGATLKEGKDAEAIRLFFDFGGSPAGTNIKISKIYFEEAVSLNYDDADNLWKAVDDGTMFDAFGYWFADNGWTQIANSECVHSGDTYEITLPEGMGGSQWQGQFHIDTKLTASGSKAYNFQLVIEADNDCPGVTIKLTDAGDTNFFCEGRHDITADEPFVYTLKKATLKEGTDASAIRLFFDFGGSPAGTKVKISKIVFKEAQ